MGEPKWKKYKKELDWNSLKENGSSNSAGGTMPITEKLQKDKNGEKNWRNVC